MLCASHVEAPDVPGKRPLEPLVQEAGSTAFAGGHTQKIAVLSPQFFCLSKTRQLLERNAACLDDLRPLVDLGLDVSGEFLRAIANRVGAIRCEAFLHFL